MASLRLYTFAIFAVILAISLQEGMWDCVFVGVKVLFVFYVRRVSFKLKLRDESLLIISSGKSHAFYFSSVECKFQFNEEFTKSNLGAFMQIGSNFRPHSFSNSFCFPLKNKIEYSVEISASALKCWVCVWSSIGNQNNDFCGDPFDEKKITDEQRKNHYVDCDRGCGKIVVHKKCMYWISSHK